MIITEAKILNQIQTDATITASVSSVYMLPDTISTTATLKNLILSCATITSKIASCAVILNSGINSEPCPIIICIDGGLASTTVYPPVNGLLNGGSA